MSPCLLVLLSCWLSCGLVHLVCHLADLSCRLVYLLCCLVALRNGACRSVLPAKMQVYLFCCLADLSCCLVHLVCRLADLSCHLVALRNGAYRSALPTKTQVPWLFSHSQRMPTHVDPLIQDWSVSLLFPWHKGNFFNLSKSMDWSFHPTLCFIRKCIFLNLIIILTL